MIRGITKEIRHSATIVVPSDPRKRLKNPATEQPSKGKNTISKYIRIAVWSKNQKSYNDRAPSDRLIDVRRRLDRPKKMEICKPQRQTNLRAEHFRGLAPSVFIYFFLDSWIYHFYYFLSFPSSGYRTSPGGRVAIAPLPSVESLPYLFIAILLFKNCALPPD